MSKKKIKEFIQLGKERDKENSTVMLERLQRRLDVAKECLKTPEDRWDYEQISKEIEDLKWEIIEAEKTYKAAKGRSCNFTESELDEIVQHYNEVVNGLAPSYLEAQKEALELTRQYVNGIKSLLSVMNENTKQVNDMNGIHHYLPREQKNLLATLPYQFEKGNQNCLSVRQILNKVTNNVRGLM